MLLDAVDLRTKVHDDADWSEGVNQGNVITILRFRLGTRVLSIVLNATV